MQPVACFLTYPADAPVMLEVGRSRAGDMQHVAGVTRNSSAHEVEEVFQDDMSSSLPLDATIDCHGTSLEST